MKYRLSFDDATVQDIKVAKLVTKYRFERDTTFFWPVAPMSVNEPKGRRSLGEAQMENIARLFQIGSHTVTHPLLTRIPLETAAIQIYDSRKMLQEKFEQPINQFAYPRGYANSDIQELVKKAGYTSARSTLVGYIHESENPYFQQVSVHVGYDRKEYGGKNWLEYALFMLEEAKSTPNAVFSLFGHSYEMDANDAFGDFETLLKEMDKAR
jgi:peptidoglycan/xylan/chitin deacetylase (PgdA/CDA1 family)